MKTNQELISKTYPLSSFMVAELESIIEVVTIDKSVDFVQKNTSNSFEYIVADGVCRTYVEDYEGNEATLSFYTQGDVIPPNQVRTVLGKSLYNIQSLTTVKLLCFSYVDFASMMSKHAELEKWGRTVYDTELQNKVSKELELITLPARERLEKFRQRFPSLENTIPHHYIASYLGISPVSLSRLRADH